MQLVDSHCHLPLIEGGEAGFEGILARAAAAGVGHMLCVSVDLESYAGVRSLARAYQQVSCSVGVHPNTDTPVREPSLEELVAEGGQDYVVAIGETGLDYFRSEGDLKWQRDRFRRHIRAAREVAKPLIIHCREAAADVIRVLREERAEEVGGVMHCFVEDWDTASAAMDLGFYISLSGIVTFKTAHALQTVSSRLPLERVLVETDAPWLAPVPKRGRQNEPAYVRHTAEFLATLRGELPVEFARATTDNFHRLFRLPADKLGTLAP